MYKKWLIAPLLILGGQMQSLALDDELAVVVNSQHHTQLSKQEIAQIFLGKSHHLANGDEITPIDHVEGKPIRQNFYRKVVNKEPSEIVSYWTRIIFTGKGHPPETAYNDDAVLEHVSSNPGSIGYVSADSLTTNRHDNISVVLMVQ